MVLNTEEQHVKQELNREVGQMFTTRYMVENNSMRP